MDLLSHIDKEIQGEPSELQVGALNGIEQHLISEDALNKDALLSRLWTRGLALLQKVSSGSTEEQHDAMKKIIRTVNELNKFEFAIQTLTDRDMISDSAFGALIDSSIGLRLKLEAVANSKAAEIERAYEEHLSDLERREGDISLSDL